MPEEKKFYRVNNFCDKLEPGKEIKISRAIDAWAGDYDLSPLIALSEKELTAKQKDSVGLETKAYETLRKSTVAWEERAGQTLLLDRALEYVRTKEVPHTSNKWKHTRAGPWEISNRVYKMWYEVTKDYINAGAWRVTWSLEYNVPRQPEHGLYTMQYTGDYIKIAGQSGKKYDSMEAAQNYIQGRFDLYANLFQALSPPVPDKEKRMFSVNGHLLPGYTVEPKRETVVAGLLEFLEDSDTPPPEPPQEKPDDQPKSKTPTKQKKSPAKRRPAR